MLLSLALLLACSDKGDDTAGGPGDGGAGDGGAEAPVEEGCEDRHAALLAAFEAELQDYGIPSASLAVMEDGVITCRAARGHRGDAAQTPADVETLFQLGSTTKMYTALALLQKVDAGVLTLDQSLAQAYPDSEFTFDDSWNDEVVLEDLLTHRGSFYDYGDPLGSGRDEALESWHQDVYFPYLWLMTDPGWFWNYANPNFSIAGLVVEQNDDRFYADVMVQDVFGGLGMDRSYLRRDDVAADGNYALGYGYVYESATSADLRQAESLDEVPDGANMWPAGIHTWSTPSQVLHMARFLMQGDPTVLDDELRQAMTQPQVPVPSGFLFPFGVDAYGYGVMVADGVTMAETEHYPVPMWQHGGNTTLYTSDFYVLPEHGFAISVLSAGYGTGFYGTVATAMRTLVDLPPAEAMPEWVVDPDGLDGHVGTYDDSYNVGEMVVTRTADGLGFAMPFLDSLGYVVSDELTPLTTDVWLVQIDGYWYDLTFHPGPKEGQSGFLSNRLFAGARVDDARRAVSGAGPHLRLPPWQEDPAWQARLQWAATRAACCARP